MFYILHKRKLIPIDPDRVYAFCPQCGVLHAVDLQAEISDGDCDLLTTNIYAVLVRFLSGMVTPSVWIWSGASVLGMLLGVFLGRLVYSRVKLEMLKQWIYVFIALMGAWTALSHFLKN